jgi:hypothetical protein
MCLQSRPYTREDENLWSTDCPVVWQRSHNTNYWALTGRNGRCDVTGFEEERCGMFTGIVPAFACRHTRNCLSGYQTSATRFKPAAPINLLNPLKSVIHLNNSSNFTSYYTDNITPSSEIIMLSLFGGKTCFLWLPQQSIQKHVGEMNFINPKAADFCRLFTAVSVCRLHSNEW